MENLNKKIQKKSGKSRRDSAEFSPKNNFNPSKTSSVQKAKGGRTTISPPAKIFSEEISGVHVLASNIDTLKLSINVVWEDPYFFLALEEAKILAQSENEEYPIDFRIKEFNENNYIFNVKPHGSQGYEWILLNNEYSLLIGNWEKPKSRPSILLTIRSETLWRRGPKDAIRFILSFIENQQGKIQETKISRLDLCLDALFPEKIWNGNLLKYKVTRATSARKFYTHDVLSGISIGKDKISARMYDKPLEIEQQSKKVWLYDIWGVALIPEHYRIIRTEFQLRREVIKELGIHTIDILFDRIIDIWAYCTQKWLKFQNHPGKQSNQRATLPWWEKIQTGFDGVVSGYPMIRVKASNADKDKLCQQIIGFLSSFAALTSQTSDYFDYKPLNFKTTMELFNDTVFEKELLKSEFPKLVEHKIAKYQRTEEKMKDALAIKAKLGFK